MTLPIIDTPTYNIKVPSTQQNARFRSMTIKEEKVLLVAKESQDDSDILNAVIQIVKNCSLDNDLKIDKLPMFDIEYLFLKLRSVSVSNIAKMSFTETWTDLPTNQEKTKIHDFEVNLDEVEMKIPEIEKEDYLIKINEDIGIELQFPPITMNLSKEYQEAETEAQIMDILLKNSVKSIYDGDNKITDFTREELQRFIDSLPSSFFDKVTAFFEKQPSLFHELTYTTHNGETQKIELRSLSDFFTF